MHDLWPEKILQRRKQSRGCLLNDRLAGQRNYPREVCSRTGKARFNHQPFRPVGEMDQRALIRDRDFGGIGNSGNDHAVGQCHHRQEQEKQE